MMFIYYVGGLYDWLKYPLWHAMLKLNQPSSVPVLLSCFFLTLSCFSHACTCACSSVMKPIKAVILQMAKCVTFDILFQSRDQDGDPSKHPWAKPGSVKPFCVYVCMRVWAKEYGYLMQCFHLYFLYLNTDQCILVFVCFCVFVCVQGKHTIWHWQHAGPPQEEAHSPC